jgi:hypothetical protein
VFVESVLARHETSGMASSRATTCRSTRCMSSWYPQSGASTDPMTVQPQVNQLHSSARVYSVNTTAASCISTAGGHRCFKSQTPCAYRLPSAKEKVHLRLDGWWHGGCIWILQRYRVFSIHKYKQQVRARTPRQVGTPRPRSSMILPVWYRASSSCSMRFHYFDFDYRIQHQEAGVQKHQVKRSRAPLSACQLAARLGDTCCMLVVLLYECSLSLAVCSLLQASKATNSVQKYYEL